MMTVDLHLHTPAGPVVIKGTITNDDVGDPNPADVVSAWLANIDPAELERAALAAMDIGAGSVAAEMLGVLRRWAGGNP